MIFKIRKLCSSVDEYEAMANEYIDLDTLFASLLISPGIDVIYSPPILTILFEDDGTVFKLYPSGRALVNANFRDDVDRACSVLIGIIQANNDSNSNEIRTD
jgi:hypothetical protein